MQTTGFDVTTNVGGHGVVAMLFNGKGPTVMMRADLDALPVTEQTGLVYASQGAGAPEPTVEISQGTPSLFNDEDLAARLTPVFRRVAGPDNVIDPEPSMGGEDFSHYGRAGIPILMFGLGAVNEQRLERYRTLGQTPPSLHSPLFYPDIEETLTTGVPAMASAALELFRSPAD